MVNWGKIIFGGVDSSDYGIYITGEGVYNAPERAVEFVSVPGRDGDIAIDQGRFSNIRITYPSGTFGKTQEEFREAVSAFRNAILSLRGYQRLEDTYHPDEYRMAVYTAGLEVSPVHYGTAGEFGITFECKPQRWLNCGDYPVPIQSGQFMDNPTLFESKPVLLSQGYGQISFNGFSIGLENEPMGIIELDPVNKSIRDGSMSASFSVELENYRLEPGDDIVMVWNQTTANAGMYFKMNGDEVSDISLGSFSNCRQEYISHYDDGDDIYFISFILTPSANITFNYGTSSTHTFSAVLSFTLGSTSIQYSYTVTMVYDGDMGFTFTLTWAKVSASGVTFDSRSYHWFRIKKWYLDSTFPSWNQGYEYVVIDCDIGEAYAVDSDGYVSLNKWVNFGSDLPTLGPGQNKITFDNTVTSLQIKPRWWKV